MLIKSYSSSEVSFFFSSYIYPAIWKGLITWVFPAVWNWMIIWVFPAVWNCFFFDLWVWKFFIFNFPCFLSWDSWVYSVLLFQSCFIKLLFNDIFFFLLLSWPLYLLLDYSNFLKYEDLSCWNCLYQRVPCCETVMAKVAWMYMHWLTLITQILFWIYVLHD